jgi:hypothetical protein
MFIHLVLAGVFMYLLARALGIGRAGSFVAASVYTCNGFNMALLYLGHMCPIQSYIWLPIVIYFLNRALTSETPYFMTAIAGLFWGIQILAGAPQDAFYTFLASMLFLACHFKAKSDWHRNLLRLSCVALLLFIIGAGVASIQIVPAFEFVGESVRASLDSYESVTQGSYPLKGIITTALPHFFGSYAGTYWVSNVPWSVPQQSLYVGILPLMLLFFVYPLNSNNRRILIFAVFLAAFALILAFGRNTPVYRLAYLLPGFDRFRAPSKIIILWVFAVGLLAGKGMDGLSSMRGTSLARRLTPFLFLAMTILLLDILFFYDRSVVLNFFSPFILDEAIPSRMTYAANSISAQFHRLTIFSLLSIFLMLLLKRKLSNYAVGAGLLCALLLVDLGQSNGRGVRPDDHIYRAIENIKTGLDASIGKDKSIYRVGSHKFGLGPNLEMYLGYQAVGGFTALFPSRYYEYITEYAEHRMPVGWQGFNYGVNENNVFMDLLNVKYDISHNTRSYDLRKTYLPRAFIVPDYTIVKREELLQHLKRADFDPKKTVLFEEGQEADLPKRSHPSSVTPGQVKMISSRPDSIVLETDAPAPGFLFLSEMFYPDWKAFLDEQPRPIRRGNYLFRVIEIPAGHHVVRFVFEPFTIKLGIGLTFLTLLMIFAMVVSQFRRRIPLLNRLFLP